MRKADIAMAVFAVVATATTASGWGSLISSFPSPASSKFPNGIGVGYPATQIYITTDEPDRHYRTTWTGSIVRSHTLRTTSTRGCAAGIMGAIGYYWVVNNDPPMIYRIGYNSGSIYHSFAPAFSDPYGLAYQQSGYILYGVSSSGKRLYRMSVSGSISASYPLTFQPNGVGFGGGYLWITEPEARTVRKCSLTGSVYDSFSVSNYGYPAGCAFDGTYVWVGINAPLHSLLRFEVGGSSIEPSSFGKVKAIFK